MTIYRTSLELSVWMYQCVSFGIINSYNKLGKNEQYDFANEVIKYVNVLRGSVIVLCTIYYEYVNV